MKRLPITFVAAFLILALTATAAFAARNPHAFAPQTAGAPVVVPDEPAPADKAEASEAPEATESEAAETEADKTEAPDTEAAEPSNHGSIVSEAAQASTPAGCRNHGEYVSGVARGLIDPSATAAPGGSVCDVLGDKHGNGNDNHGKGHAPKPRGSQQPD